MVVLDYDGTLTPIVDTPDKAIMHEDMRNAVIKLSNAALSESLVGEIFKIFNIW